MEPKSSSRHSLCVLAAMLQLLLFAPSLAAAFNYADALAKSIIFFEGQRSGKLPPGNRMPWRGDSGLRDGAQYNVDLVGGYYDAGDNVKFGLPMAFTTTMLAWSVVDFGKFMGAELPHARAAVRWGADYLLKAATSTPDTLYVQVADPNQDHRCWERPEDMDTPRSVYAVTKDKPGSDVAAETAAALAASAIVFRRADPAYSSRLLHAAMKVFNFADRHRGSYSDSLSAFVCPFYCSYSGYHDELLWAASWLHRASNNVSFMSYVQVNGMQLGAGDDDYSFSWDDKRVGTKVLLSKGFLRKKLQGLQLYKAHSDNYICSLVPGTSSFQSGQYTPGGLVYKEGASNMQYVTTATFLLLAYAKYLRSSGSSVVCGAKDVSPGELIALAKRQVDYILGKNPAGMSYMVGFGARYPRRVHHRGASMPSVRAHPGRIGCEEGFRYLHSGAPDANVLVGAVVGGPDARDAFADDRDSYGQSEPATYINAPLVGALAFFAGTAKY
ncbi:endoglucanase 19-like [Phragmites australis]|uniref:endoglucanase 19-like n=1 Tax=Phragmites australis TaxID=29695 RepID=UPI002D78A79B|nr:endoglucanase 19-like [Phragmites australis]